MKIRNSSLVDPDESPKRSTELLGLIAQNNGEVEALNHGKKYFFVVMYIRTVEQSRRRK